MVFVKIRLEKAEDYAEGYAEDYAENYAEDYAEDYTVLSLETNCRCVLYFSNSSGLLDFNSLRMALAASQSF